MNRTDLYIPTLISGVFIRVVSQLGFEQALIQETEEPERNFVA